MQDAMPVRLLFTSLSLLLVGCQPESSNSKVEIVERGQGVRVDTIETPIEFYESLQVPHLVIHIDVDWAIQAVQSRPVIKQFVHALAEDPKFRAITVRRIDCTHQTGPVWDALSTYLHQQKADTSVMVTGYGALVWVRSGQVVESIHSAAAVGVTDLIALTATSFEILPTP